MTRDSLGALLEKYVRGSVPPPALDDARERVESRLSQDTGIHDLRKLERILKDQYTEAALSAAKEQLKEMRAKDDRRGERVWQALLGVFILLVGALLAKLGMKP
jgi:hypothetical protein